MASNNLFSVIEVPLPSQVLKLSESEQAAPLILSRSAYSKYFANDPHAIGKIMNIANQRVVIAAVISDKVWNLPGQIDAWLLEDRQHIDALPAQSYGFMIANAAPGLFVAHPDERWNINVPVVRKGYEEVQAVSLTQVIKSNQRAPVITILIALIMACLNLPAITTHLLGDHPHSRDDAWTARFYRLMFLSVKVMLLLPIVLCGTLIVVHGIGPDSSDTCLLLQGLVAFLGFLFAFRWAIHDQRQRCPKCLQRLGSPARIGQTSQSFLGWSGTERVCFRGHGLLHIPAWSTSWFGTQRWFYRDSSWNGLFIVRSVPY
jgi:hypothetical protein